ncbi:Periplasmic divalent cation tolerance protein CutA [Grimontia indica]|uniref:Periplasmic divalent cation tolerance protein CutA n=1 Tax=Grimontia indica TaxID=1056512 RepID=R1IPV1_9GAMM|nr:MULTISPECIES: divalent-cation tolerance protein CutA [Grimontia]EOD77395.1 Periplasmic divalent cation tolerance protein CutA [Grimontia indica]
MKVSTDSYVVVMTTFADDNIGKRIIESLLEKKLAACVQVLPIQSYYHWQGKIASDTEKQVMIKTKKSLYQDVEAEICRLHDYDVPEVIQLPIEAGLPAYLYWISESCEQ